MNILALAFIDVDIVFCARYELNMMTAAHKTVFENLFKEKKFYEIPNALYRGWLGFKIAAVGSEEEVFDNILAAKTVTSIPRGKKRKVDGPTGAAKWDVTSAENLALFKAREDEKSEKEAKKKEAAEKKKEKEEEREAKKREKEEQAQEKKRQREERKTQATARREAAAAAKAAKKAEVEAKKVEKTMTEESQVDEAIPGPSGARKSLRPRKC